MFNDHGTGNAEEAHDHGEEAVAHTHFLYGESVEEALSADNWSTMYYDADASGEQILLTMLGVTKDERISAGYFTESDVVDRATMVDWYGDWQSAYPLVADGSLDFVWPEKAEAGDGRTAEEYKEYYASSYKTEWDRLVIKGDTITYYKNDGTSITATYEYKGPTPLIYYDDGTAYMRFNYEAVGDPQGAPRYVQFADHNCRPTSNLEHFHLYMGEDGFDKLYENMTNWPTYYPSDMSALEVGEEMIGHDSSAHSHSHDHEEEEVEFDEHVWTSPKNAKLIIAQITEELASLDPANAQTYRTNAAAYLSKLDALDLAFQDVVGKAARNTIVFGDRFPFRYFADAYDLEYYAAFSGCSTETEASAATIKFLIDKVNDEQIPVVFHIELSNEKIADTICEATGAKKLLMHTVHNVTRDDFDKGIGYLELMTEDIERLKEALW
jgi:zinc transport system substrate-binding protein